MPAQIRRISAQYLNDPEEITVKTKTTTSANITQRYLVVSYQQKIDALTRILEVENFEGMIVFTRTKNESETVAEKLRARGYTAAAINGDVAGAVQRERTVNQLKSGKLDISSSRPTSQPAASTSSASATWSTTTCRSTPSRTCTGSAARAVPDGAGMPSLRDPRERRMLTAIERKATRQPLTEMSLPSVDDVNAHALTRFDDAITAALEDTARSRPSATSSPTTSRTTTCRGRRGRGARRGRAGRHPRCSWRRRRSRSPGSTGTARPCAPRRRARPGWTGETGAATTGGSRRTASRWASAAGRTAPDRRGARERGGPAPQRLRRDPDPSGLLARRASGGPVARHPQPADRHPDLGGPHRPAPGPGRSLGEAQRPAAAPLVRSRLSHAASILRRPRDLVGCGGVVVCAANPWMPARDDAEQRAEVEPIHIKSA